MVICVQHNEHVLHKHNKRLRPKDERDASQHVLLGRVWDRGEDGREGVHGGRADVALCVNGEEGRALFVAGGGWSVGWSKRWGENAHWGGADVTLCVVSCGRGVENFFVISSGLESGMG